MRRALVPIAASALSLLFATPALAPAAPTPPSAAPAPSQERRLRFYEEEEDVLFYFRSESFHIGVFAEDDDGDQTVSLAVGRGGLTTQYLVPATITDHSIAARFGSLGSLHFELRTRPGTRECRGLLNLAGSLIFTGEGGYVHIDAHHAHGAFLEKSYSDCPPPGKAPKITEVSTGVHLEATAGTPRSDGARSVTVTEYRGIYPARRTVRINAYLLEERGRMKIARGASTTSPASVFGRNLDAGTARLDPPAPFTGVGELVPGPDGMSWEGTLAVPVLGGGEPIELTGPEFQASLADEEVIDR